MGVPSRAESIAWGVVWIWLSTPVVYFTIMVPTDDLSQFSKMLVTTLTLKFGTMFVLTGLSEAISVSLGLVYGQSLKKGSVEQMPSSKTTIESSIGSPSVTLVILEP